MIYAERWRQTVMGRGTPSSPRWRTGARRWSYSSGPPIRGSLSVVLFSYLSLAEPSHFHAYPDPSFIINAVKVVF
jgi:hypothetical protein